jgi:hypothetical protein
MSATKTTTTKAPVALPAIIDHGMIEGVGAFSSAVHHPKRKVHGAKLRHITFEGLSVSFGVGAKVYRLCWKCDGEGWSGSLSYYQGVYDGVCFGCNGAGYTSVYADTVEQAQIKAGRAIAAEARKIARENAKAEAALAERKAKFAAWVTENKTFITILTTFIKTYKLVKETKAADGYVRQADGDDVSIIEFAEDIMRGHILTAKQISFAISLMAKVQERKAAGEATRYAADVKARITFTGKVTRSIELQPVDLGYGNVSYRRLVIIEGTGEHTGCIFKWIGTSTLAFTLEEGEEVKLTGTVKDHTTYNDAKQTVMTRIVRAK